MGVASHQLHRLHCCTVYTFFIVLVWLYSFMSFRAKRGVSGSLPHLLVEVEEKVGWGP